MTDLLPQGTIDKITSHFASALARQRAGQVSAGSGFRLGVARKRFREGLTTEGEFADELRSLFLPEEEITLELVAGRLDYATDYSMDLIAAWRDGVRKGNISVDQFNKYLTSIGMVPDRVAGFMLREIVRLKTDGEPGLLAPLTPYYETDAGKIQVDTIRRQRRKLLITRDQEIAGLMEIGMPGPEAESTANNDDVRIAEKGGPE